MRPAPSSDRIEHLIDVLYEKIAGATEGCALCTILPYLCEAFGAPTSGLVTQDLSNGSGTFAHSFDVGAGFYHACNGELLQENSWLSSLSVFQEGSILPENEGVQARAFILIPHLKSQSVLHHLCGVVARNGSTVSLFGLLRGPDASPFGAADRATLTHFLPHLKRWLMVHDGMLRDRAERGNLVELMDRLPVAFFLVDQSGRAQLHNRAAKEMLVRDGDLYLRDGYLIAKSSQVTKEFRQLISEIAADHRNPDGADTERHFVFPRGRDRLPLICVLYPVSSPGTNGSNTPDCRVAVLVKDPHAEGTDCVTDFVGVYGLTNAEARLITFLMNGHGLFAAARKLGITKNTARTHMRNIYSKVGENRQVDVIRLLHRFRVV